MPVTLFSTASVETHFFNKKSMSVVVLNKELNYQVLGNSYVIDFVFQVRGVGAGGIVSSCFCLLYKLYTLKLTRKQLIGLCTHTDSPFIRGIGFMYARSVVSTWHCM